MIYPNDVRYLWWLLLAIVVALLAYFLAPVLTPFLAAAILAYICNPVVDRMQRHRVPRTLGVAIMLLLLAALVAVLVLILIPLFQRQISALAVHMPQFIDWLHRVAAPWVKDTFNIELDIDSLRSYVVDNMHAIQGVATRLLPSLKSGGLALLGILLNLVLIPVVLFYFLRDWNKMLAALDEMIPRRWHPTVTKLAHDIDVVLGEFLRGQLSVILLQCVFYVGGLWLVGLDSALPVGIIAGVLTFVPYLGTVVGVVLATLTGFVQFANLSGVLWVWGVFILGKLLEDYLWMPYLVGDRIGLHPVTVIFALLAFGYLFGFFGVLLALPVSAALLVWLRHLRQRYFDSGLYNT
jgi:predicted PurR-regulated permease PerM